MIFLFIGDIFGNAGLRAIKNELPKLIQANHVDCVIANAENTTNGKSLSLSDYEILKSYGINYFTFGNHTWRLDDIKEVLKNENTVRPLNLKSSFEYAKLGEGSRTFLIKNKKVRITNLLGNSINFHENQTNPFVVFNNLLKTTNDDIHIVDLHAETTGEKNAFLQQFTGKVTAILGTHTHVQTADERIYKNTAYITDVGMTGGANGVIGALAQPLVDIYMEKVQKIKITPDDGKYQLNGILLFVDDKTNICSLIKRINIIEK